MIYIQGTDFFQVMKESPICTHQKEHIGLHTKTKIILIDMVVCPKELSRSVIKQNGHRLCSEYKMQGLTSKRDSYCAKFCLYIIYLTKVLIIDFKSAVLNMYYETISRV